MAAANFFVGNIQVNGGYEKIPALYTSANQPPYQTSTQSGYTFVNINVTSVNSNFIATNPDSNLWVRYNGNTVGIWKTIYDLADNVFHKVYEMPNGDYLQAKRNPNAPDSRNIDIEYRNSNDQLQASGAWAIIASDVPYACFSVFEDENRNKYFQQILGITWSNEKTLIIQAPLWKGALAWGQYASEESSDIIGSGGGATHIAKVTGTLATLENNLSDILIVAGGGGGGLVAEGTPTAGANGGGISGSGNNSADQSTGYAFGQGEASGGGGGLYGGYKAANGDSGGAGSGYIGNALLDAKKMVGFNVPTSDVASTKTESVNVYNATAEENKPKAGNGFAKITWLRDLA